MSQDGDSIPLQDVSRSAPRARQAPNRNSPANSKRLLRRIQERNARKKRTARIIIAFVIVPALIFTLVGFVDYLTDRSRGWRNVESLLLAALTDFILIVFGLAYLIISIMLGLLEKCLPFNLLTTFVLALRWPAVAAITSGVTWSVRAIFHDEGENHFDDTGYGEFVFLTCRNTLIICIVWAIKAFIVTMWTVLQSHDDLLEDVKLVRSAEKEVLALLRGPEPQGGALSRVLSVDSLTYEELDIGDDDDTYLDIEAARVEAESISLDIFTRLGLNPDTSKLQPAQLLACLPDEPVILQFLPRKSALPSNVTLDDNDDLVRRDSDASEAGSLTGLSRRSRGKSQTIPSATGSGWSYVAVRANELMPFEFEDIVNMVLEVLMKKAAVRAYLTNLQHLNSIVVHIIDIASGLLMVVLLLALYGYDIGNFWVTFSATMVTFGFALGDYLKGILASLVLIFVGKAYVAGDVIRLGDSSAEYTVVKVSLFYTITRDANGCPCQFNNSYIAGTSVHNLSRTNRIKLSVTSVVNRETQLDAIHQIRRNMDTWLLLDPRTWYNQSRIRFGNVTSDTHYELIIEVWCKSSWADKAMVSHAQTSFQSAVMKELIDSGITIEDSPTVTIS